MQRARQEFGRAFESAGKPAIAAAPGRVNLIGEHTDYNDGFVLPMAIDRHVVVAFAPRPDRLLRACSLEFGETREISLDALAQRTSRRGRRRSARGGWFGYVAGVAWAMLGAGFALRGADLAIAGDVPVGAGLSSSAALEIAVARALAAASDLPWEPRAAAQLAQLAEHEFAGVACGIMDQLSVAAAREGCALLIDCRSLGIRDVPIPESARIVVFDSGVRRELTTSAYNDRRASCERVVAALQNARTRGSGRCVTPTTRCWQSRRRRWSPVDVRRASHVIAENRRPAAMADAFASGDLARAGRLMMHSHASLRDLYEVSTPELDALVDLAVDQPGCTGARLTGAGFGGSRHRPGRGRLGRTGDVFRRGRLRAADGPADRGVRVSAVAGRVPCSRRHRDAEVRAIVRNSLQHSSYNLMMHSTLCRRGCTALLLLPAPSAAQSAQARQSPSRGLTELSQSLQDLAERVSPSVVQIFVTGYAEPDEDEQAPSEPALERSSGSGVIVDPDGYIVTNAHVVERATRIEVELRARRDRRRAGRLGPAAARPGRRRAGRGGRSRDRHRRPEGRSQGAAGAAVRRLRGAAARADRAGVRQPARARVLGDARAWSAPWRAS